MSETIDRLEPVTPDETDTDQPELGSWTGDERVCATCGHPATEVDLEEYGNTVYCAMCAPEGKCNRCGTWTHETGLGTYPLCSDCQTNSGGQKHDPVESGPSHVQAKLPTDTGSTDD